MQVGLTKLHAEDGPWGADRALLGFVLPVSFTGGEAVRISAFILNSCLFLCVLQS